MSRRLVLTAFPTPRLRSLLSGPREFDAGVSRCIGRFALGRAAIYWAFRGLGIKRGSTAWLPDYHCGVEVQAAIDAGMDVQYYRISRDLTIDEEDLRMRVRARPGPVLIIHYFGFPQPQVRRIADTCAELGVTLIEDCAHALFSSMGEIQLGSVARLAAFSLRKTLPVYDGATLVLNHSQLDSPPRMRPSINSYKLLLKDRVRSVLGPGFVQTLRDWCSAREPPRPSQLEWEQQSGNYLQGHSMLSRRMAAAAVPAAIVAVRRRNWELVDARLAAGGDHTPVWTKLPVGVCPLFYCLWSRTRDDTMRRLLGEGVETFRFGARPHPSLDLSVHPAVANLRDNIVGFPIHQQLEPEALHRGLDVLARVAGTR